MNMKRARLDSKGTAKPLTRIVSHAREGQMVGGGRPLVEPEYENEHGERVPLVEPEYEIGVGMKTTATETTTFDRADGSTYDVPVFRPRVGESVDACAKRAGGKIPARSERRAAEAAGRVIACVCEGGIEYPVVGCYGKERDS